MSLEKPFDVSSQFDEVKRAAIQAIRNSFPIEGNRHRLVLNEVWVDDNLDVTDFASQKTAKMAGGSWAVPVFASLSLEDKITGGRVDQVNKIRLLDLPKVTRRSSYIVEGNEYQVVNQLRLRPGVYTRVKQNGELESKVNMAKGGKFDILMKPETGVFIIEVGTSNVKMYPVLRDLGISDAEIEKTWGKDLFAANVNASRGVMDTEIKKFQSKMMHKPEATREGAILAVRAYLDETKLDPETTKMTMGKSFEKADAPLILAASKRLLATARQEQPPDDRDSMIFKSIHSVEDFVRERLSLSQDKVQKSILNRLDRKDKIREIISKAVFDEPLKTLFTSTSLAAPTEQTNPLHMLSGHMKLTIMGEGGIQSEQAVTLGARAVHPSEMGFVDPVMTPQSNQAGAVTRLATGIKKRGNTLYTSVINIKTGKLEHIDAIRFNDAIVAFPDQFTQDQKTGKFKPIAARVKVMKENNEVDTVDASRVQYKLVDPKSMFSISTNLVPFLNSTQGNRALMASAQYEQATGLKDREQPLVQVSTGAATTPGMTHGDTAEKAIGMAMAHVSPADGIISKIEKDFIHIKGSDGKPYKVGIYHDFPLNQKTFMNAEIKVKVGDKVKKNQLLADNNYTKDGVLSMGTNLRVAYVPSKGYNFEDGIVISESAAKKLTSEHMHRIGVQFSDESLTSKSKFMAYAPGMIKPANALKLGEDGVILEGQKIDYGDVVIAYLTKRSMNPENVMIAQLHKALVKGYVPRPEIWDYEFQGLVTKVVKSSKEIQVYIKTEEPASIGDKLSGRYGNKGIISKILPDGEMPHTADGKHMDVLLNPIGIPSRLNPGQIMETAASKIAEKTGKPYLVHNFKEEDNHAKVMADLKKHGLTDKETLYDPEDGKPLGAPIMVGKQFLLKLDHPVRKKFSARSGGPGSAYTMDMQPASDSGESGQSMDHLTIYSMLAHGAKANLHEMATYKAEKNDEFWRALQMGQPLPPPKSTFVFEKFVNMLKSSGVNVEKKGNQISLMPMTDNHVSAISSGPLRNALMLKGKNLQPEKGGMFDPQITGGASGSQWAHIDLHEPIPSPVFENAIKTVTGITQNTFDAIVGGKQYVDQAGKVVDKQDGAFTGGKAIQLMLSKIDVNARLDDLRKQVVNVKPTQLNKVNKEIRYLRALQENNLKPTDYVITKVPVIPPKFRPIYPMPDGSLNTSDANFLYRDLSLVNSKLNEISGMPDPEKEDLRSSMYKGLKALVGLGNPITYKDYRGYIELIKGRTQPKTGFYQRKLVRRRQDLTGRSTIIPEPSMGVDQVGLPKAMAWEIYKPFVVRELVQRGFTPLTAQDEVKKQSPIAFKALEAAVSKRPVMLNRAPSLHKHSTMAFNPVLTDGKTIKLHPLVTKGYNADFDGDQALTYILTFIDRKSILEVDRIMGSGYVEERSMSARMKEQIPVAFDSGEICIVHLQDFPHGPLIRSKEGKNGKIDFYAAIPGMKVLSYSDQEQKMAWSDVAYWSVHHDRLMEVIHLRSGRSLYSDDDPRAVYGVDCTTLDFVRRTPSDALSHNMFVPRSDRIDVEDQIISDVKAKNDASGRAWQIHEDINLNEEFGYLIGVLAGDGWISNNRQVCMTNIDQNVMSRFDLCARTILKEDGAKLTKAVRDGATGGAYGSAVKGTISSTNMARFIEPLIGVKAKNKHLPPFFFKSCKEFRHGLFAGLMDTDGCISISRAKAKPQLMSSFYSVSLRLAQEVKLLAATLGIKGRITSTKTPAGEPGWILSFSNYDIKKWNGKGMVCSVKLDKLRSIEVEQTPALMKEDVVPISASLAKHITKVMKAPRNASKEHKSMYTVFNVAVKYGSVSRYAARRIFEYADREMVMTHEDASKWMRIVEDVGTSWDQVESVEKTEVRETGYDLTVPGFETFMDINGVIVSNTMAVHIPATEKARLESIKMLPTNNVFDVSTGDVMLMPTNEMILGLYFITREGKPVKRKFANVTEAKTAMEKGDINVNSKVTISNQETTLGRALINSVLPAEFRDPNVFLDKKNLSDLLKRIAKANVPNFGQIVDSLKDIGNKHAFKTGFTVGMEDVAPMKIERAKVMAETKADLGGSTSKARIIEAYTSAAGRLDAELKKGMEKADNSLFHMHASGAKGSMENLRQINGAPLLVQDHTGQTIASPIIKSYSEGLDTAGYWSSMYGARAGTIGKSLQSSVPGYFSKRLMSSVMGNTITKRDCGTDKGIDGLVSDRDTTGRYLSAGNPLGVGRKNDEVTTHTLSRAKAIGLTSIKVRSPLTCEAAEGTCALCFGHTEDGKGLQVGDNAGVITATAISEPLVQMSMNAFHTGGVVGASGGIAAVAKGYDRIAQILEMTEVVKGKATLSTMAGKVSKIEPNPAGGNFVVVAGEKHFVPQSRLVSVKPGQQVEKGDYLSDGVAKPQELADLKGIHAARLYMSKELQGAYNKKVRKNFFESVVKEMTNLAKIIRPGKSTEFEAGDHAPINKIEELNRKGAGIQYEPVLKGINTLPLASEDWMARLGTRDLAKTITEGASRGWSSNIHGTHPIPAYVYGAEFGQGTEGKY